MIHTVNPATANNFPNSAIPANEEYGHRYISHLGRAICQCSRQQHQSLWGFQILDSYSFDETWVEIKFIIYFHTLPRIFLQSDRSKPA
ncbi:hypothetical protein RCL_jg5090.t1 [Rhizophagus clarus]|uniref:Uncharacterized protein n=1 Tax=Rhizophagus clarus TaxID=94130 RepID=A0A8H3L6K2_9GLOM|nr:hypothetical protein RCL_jg5090.t1 [Rhizophagus clarus]